VYDEARIVADLTGALQLQPEQVAQLRGLLSGRRLQMEALQKQARELPPNSPELAQARAQFERARRAIMEEFMPSLRPEQQAVLGAMLARQPQQQTATRQINQASPVAPLKPKLHEGPIAGSDRLIPLPRVSESRSRRANDQIALLGEEQQILHLLNRAAFGPRPGDLERVRQMGIERYLEEQLHPEEMADEFLTRPLAGLRSMQMTTTEITQNFGPPVVRPTPAPTPTPTPKPANTLADYNEMNKAEGAAASPAMEQPPAMRETPKPAPTPTPMPRATGPQRDGALPLRELQQAKLLRAAFSEKQLQEVMVDFWYNHFNVWANKDSARWMVTSYERDVIRPHALGKFKELLVATAQSPAMLYYLDNFLSQAEVRVGDRVSGGAGEKTANEPAPPPVRRPGLNENYARELMELHTLGVDGGYTQQDVTEIARCFTGWAIVPSPNTAFLYRPRAHDTGEKNVLGKLIPAGGGIEDGLRVLDILATHPSTAKFIARKLCRRFVADDPPQSLVDRAAETFRGTDGDIRQVLRTILTAPEFYSARVYRNKIKSPFELAVSAIRATGASTDGASPLIQAVARMGQPLYLCQPPTGYSDVSAEWLNSATLLERMNFALALSTNRINGTRVEIGRFLNGDPMKDGRRTIDQLISAFIHSDISSETRDNLLNVLKEAKAQPGPAKTDAKTTQRNSEAAIANLTALILGSKDFQVK
jgi:uncharacterized protein (DUF1800 family)